MSLIWIKNAKYISEYIIEFEFSTNEIGRINLEKYLNRGVFLALKNIEEFKKFKLNSWTVEWENGADFSPEFLYSLIDSKELSYS
ncbi:hypothetical protein CBW16_11075 [Flavobacteriaceae bacterium JJC]|nr:hypothetical protein CBW16_11075 [Flavobacteriaceae bacterium JJC]